MSSVYDQNTPQKAYKRLHRGDRPDFNIITTSSHKKTCTSIQAYAPTELADKTEHQSFYDKLDQIISHHSNNIIILMGDFNAQVGAKQSNGEYVLGMFGHGKRRENGQRLIEFLLEHNLILLNSLFKKNVNNKWTWISLDWEYKNEIDYIASSHAKLCTDTSVISRLNFNTNHRMVRASFNINPAKKTRRLAVNTATTLAINNLKTSSMETFFSEIAKSDTKQVEYSYAKLHKNFTCLNTRKMDQQKYNLSEPTMLLTNERKHLFINKMKKQNIQKITELSKRIREGIRKDRKSRRLQTLVTHIITTGETRKALKELQESNNWISNLKNNQIHVTNRKDINKTATKFYQNLYSSRDTVNENRRASSITFPSNLNPNLKSYLVK
ncbi:Craniofacial development protein 2 [Eumeta japonica]|uniref:Craniofacial development protein 2 n=1 Tax=Eumeta variegata TaxID=151549 RepID=A0A4C1URU4_EUMVA|nr:Craniofacial development protein 2 [Eumeta japonica]